MDDAVDTCECILREARADNQKRNVWPSVNKVIDLMLAQPEELAPTYRALVDRLYPTQLYVALIHVVAETAAIYDPASIAAAREAAERHKELAIRIGDLAGELAGCLREQSELNNNSGFYVSSGLYTPSLINATAQSNHYYLAHLQEHFKRLACSYDDKYWPSFADILEHIAADSRFWDPAALNSVMHGSTLSGKPSRADSCRALMAAIERNRGEQIQNLPLDFKLTDGQLASLVNVAFDLPVEDWLDASNVKSIRHRHLVSQ